MCPLDVEYVHVEAWARLFAEKDELGCNTMTLGAYKICGRLSDVPTGEETDGDPGIIPDGMGILQMDIEVPATSIFDFAGSVFV